MKTRKFKSWRIEQMADAFLKHLSKDGVDGRDTLLDNFLEAQSVYYDMQQLKQAIALLLERKLVKEIENSLSFVGHFQAPPGTESDKILHPKDWLGDVEGVIRASEITAKGRDFVAKEQKLDVVGVAERKAKIEKWKERGITFCIALITALGVTLVTEPVKRVINNQQSNTNASSPLRPRLDSRQRPEPGKPTGAAAPGGRASR